MILSEEEKREASEAAYLLESKLLGKCFAQIQEASLRQWMNSDCLEKREEAWHTVRILKQVKLRLRALLISAAQKEGTNEGVFTKLLSKFKD